MKFVGSFFQFSRRVIDAAKKGGIGGEDLKKLDNVLVQTGKRDTILAKGILSALAMGGASALEVARFGALLKTAQQRILEDQKPFTSEENTEISTMFERCLISSKAARFFSTQMNALLADEVNDFIEGKTRVDIGVPIKTGQKSDKAKTKKIIDENTEEEKEEPLKR